MPPFARVFLLAAGLAISPAENAPVPFPRFSGYPAVAQFAGRPAPPKLVTSGQRLFGTKIRRAAAQGPNFAGRYTVAQWGCGIGCLSMAVIDAKTGQVYAAPFHLLRIPIDVNDPLSFRLTSRLLIVRGCPEETDCASHFYEWQAPHWKLVSSVPIV